MTTIKQLPKTDNPKLIALRAAIRMDARLLYLGADVKALVDSVSLYCDEPVKREALDLLLEDLVTKDYMTGKFMPDERKLADYYAVIPDYMQLGEKYSAHRLYLLIDELVGVDLPNVIGILASRRLIKSSNRYVNGHFMTTYHL